MFESLMITKPCVFLDLETTSTNEKEARVVQYSFIKYTPGSDGPETLTGLVNPLIPIPPAATEVHHITDDMVKDQPTFDQLCSQLFDFIKDSILIGYNIIKYDLKVLDAEFDRVGVPFFSSQCESIDLYVLWSRLFPRNLTSCYWFFTQKTLEKAHDASADTQASVEILESMMTMYSEYLPCVDVGLAQLCSQPPEGYLDRDRKFRWVDNDVVVNFGKYSGYKVAAVPVDYFMWMSTQDFPSDTASIVDQILRGESFTRS